MADRRCPDPDINYPEMRRGSYAAENGGLTFGVFDVAPRPGFEPDRPGEFLIFAEDFFSANSGDHTECFAYTSLNGNP